MLSQSESLVKKFKKLGGEEEVNEHDLLLGRQITLINFEIIKEAYFG